MHTYLWPVIRGLSTPALLRPYRLPLLGLTASPARTPRVGAAATSNDFAIRRLHYVRSRCRLYSRCATTPRPAKDSLLKPSLRYHYKVTSPTNGETPLGCHRERVGTREHQWWSSNGESPVPTPWAPRTRGHPPQGGHRPKADLFVLRGKRLHLFGMQVVFPGRPGWERKH